MADETKGWSNREVKELNRSKNRARAGEEEVHEEEADEEEADVRGGGGGGGGGWK